MSRRVSVQILGDSVSVERAFQRASSSARGFNRSTKLVEKDFSRTTRGILSGSGVFSHLGRSLAFASGGFLAFASASQAIRSSINAAESSEKALRSLGAQAKASGVAVGEAFSKAGKLEGPALKLGFNKADVEQGLATLIRGTGSAKKALSEMAAAEDVARAKGVSLSQGATIVNRALISTGNSARSLGIHFPKAASEAEKLHIILAKFAGQARANTTTTAVFNAELFNTEAIIGTALLPTLNKYLKSVGDWLTKMDQSGKLQRDVSHAAHDVESAFRAVVGVVRTIDSVTGSFTNTLKDLASVFLLLKARTALIRWGVIQSGIAGIGTNAAAAETQVGILSRSLLALRGLGPIAIAIGVTEFVSFLRAKSNDIKSQNGPNFTLQNGQTFGLGAGRAFGVSSPPTPVLPAPFVFPKFDPAKAAAAQKAVAKQKAGQPVSLLGQFNIDELKLANASIGTNTKLQRAILQSEEGISLKLRDQAKTLKDRTKFAQQAASIEDQIRAIDSAGTRAAKTAAGKDILLAKARLDLAQGDTSAANVLLKRDRARLEEELKQAKTADLRLSLTKQLTAVTKLLKTKTQGGVPLALQLAQAKADALAAGLNLQGLSKGQISAAKAIRAAEYKAIRSHRLSMQGLIDAWNQIASVNDQLKSAAANALGSFKQADTKKLVAGIGLTAEQIRALRARLSQLGPTGAIPRHGVGAFGQQVGPSGTIVIHSHVHLDKKEVGRGVTKVQQKAARRNSSQVRGPFAGGGL